MHIDGSWFQYESESQESPWQLLVQGLDWVPITIEARVSLFADTFAKRAGCQVMIKDNTLLLCSSSSL